MFYSTSFTPLTRKLGRSSAPQSYCVVPLSLEMVSNRGKLTQDFAQGHGTVFQHVPGGQKTRRAPIFSDRLASNEGREKNPLNLVEYALPVVTFGADLHSCVRNKWIRLDRVRLAQTSQNPTCFTRRPAKKLLLYSNTVGKCPEISSARSM